MRNSKTPIASGNDLLFPQASIPEVDMTKLVYFALSIFWRATRRWSEVEGGRPPKLHPGRQEKAICTFLLGRGKLPDDVVVTVAAWPYKKVYPMGLMPRADAGTCGSPKLNCPTVELSEAYNARPVSRGKLQRKQV